MASRHSKVGLQMLLDRRAREETNRFYNEAERSDMKIRQRADFETRTFSRFQAGELKRRAKKRAEEAEAQINERRKKLAELIRLEEQQFSEEITGTIETPSQRRLRLMDSLKHLKDQRQKEHDDYCKQRNEQAWRDSCDPLRHQISEALEKAVIAERDQQVIAKDMARMEEDIEEQKYVEQIKQNTQEFLESQRIEREERRMKINRNREVWLAEMRAHRERDEKEKHKEYLESLQFRTTLESKLKQDQEEAEKKRIQQEERRRELDTLNQEQLTRKRMLIDADKAIDTEYARKAAEELRQEQEDALVERIVRMKKAAMNSTLLSTQLGRTQASNDEAERLLQAAQDEANRKEDEIREKDYQQRRALMLDAVADRVKTIKLHEQQKENRKYEIEKERQELEEDLALKRQYDQEEYEKRRMLIQNQYQMLATQSRQRQELEEKAKQEERDSVAALVKSWEDEENRIQEELAHPHFMVGGRFRGLR
ncbi:Cilia- and flagella-associated protein 53 [Tritrichomonas musculus]|uniref:Cilia- and flagella-associated protein 53 n=1 Tax=Tritrichomonas musculus TaxID=1915356 RepID=A0ABR2HW39_9EUKA